MNKPVKNLIQIKEGGMGGYMSCLDNFFELESFVRPRMISHFTLKVGIINLSDYSWMRIYAKSFDERYYARKSERYSLSYVFLSSIAEVWCKIQRMLVNVLLCTCTIEAFESPFKMMYYLFFLPLRKAKIWDSCTYFSFQGVSV